MNKFLLCVILLTTSYSKDITVGNTWKFKEKNALDEIHLHIEKNKDEIEQRLNTARKKVQEAAKNYKAPNLVKLPMAKKPLSYDANMTYSLEFDIKDALGNIIYPKGYTYNITDHASLPYKIVVFDPTNKKQLSWYLKGPYLKKIDYQPMIVDGIATKVVEHINRPFFYFDERMVKRFDVRAVPSIIEQVGKRIVVTQIVVAEEENDSANKK